MTNKRDYTKEEQQEMFDFIFELSVDNRLMTKNKPVWLKAYAISSKIIRRQDALEQQHRRELYE